MSSELPLFPPLVFTIWRIGLVVTLLVFVPLALYLLHGLWRTARSIQRYAAESLTAAGGIANHTQHVATLDSTIQVATEILDVAGAVARKLDTIATVLAARAR